MPKTKPPYPEEFKREVLAYLCSTGEPLKRAAKHFSVSVETLRAWRRRSEAAPGQPPSAPGETPEQELVRLRRQNRELQLRCEILKKTVGIFSDLSASDSPRSKP